jgi:uncharacterized membrane protein
MIYILKTALAAVLFAVLDFVWIGLLLKNFYTKMLEPAIGTIRFNLGPAIFVYILLGLGVTFFSAKVGNTPLTALGLGALLGLVVYGVYDATNGATIANWSLQFALVDIFWGILATGLVSALISYVFTKF